MDYDDKLDMEWVLDCNIDAVEHYAEPEVKHYTMEDVMSRLWEFGAC